MGKMLFSLFFFFFLQWNNLNDEITLHNNGLRINGFFFSQITDEIVYLNNSCDYFFSTYFIFMYLMLNTWGIHEFHDWTSSTGHSLLSKCCNWCENMSGCIPLVTLQCLAETSHCLLSTWLKSSSEVWSSTIWRKEEDWGPLSRGTLLLLPIPAFCISLHSGTVLRWTRFLCVSDAVMAARTCRDWLAKRGGTFACVWVGCSGKNQ